MAPILEQAKLYQKFAERKYKAHYLMADKNRRKRTMLGLFFALVVSAAIFATITKSATNIEQQLATGFLGVCAVVLSVSLTFIRSTEISEQHKTAAAAYEANKLNLDIFLRSNVREGTVITPRASEELKEIATNLHEITKTAPKVPDGIWHLTMNKSQFI